MKFILIIKGLYVSPLVEACEESLSGEAKKMLGSTYKL